MQVLSLPGKKWDFILPNSREVPSFTKMALMMLRHSNWKHAQVPRVNKSSWNLRWNRMEIILLCETIKSKHCFWALFFLFTRRKKKKKPFAAKHVYFHGKSLHLQYMHIMFKYLPQEDTPLNNTSVYLLQKSRIAGSPLWESFSKFN